MTVRLLPPDDSPEREPPATPTTTLPLARPIDLPPLIELAGLRLRAGRHAAPEQIDLDVWRGEMVVLTGQPRSGRSALLNVLGLLDRPASGRYLLNGIDTAKLGDRDASALRGRQIGFVFQRKLLLPTRSVLDNVMLPLRYTGLSRQRRQRVALQSLDRVGLTAMATLLTWQLSADELARCAVARALVNRPSLLLCDDPTAGLDSETASRVIRLLVGLQAAGRTVVIATDDQLAAAFSSKLIRLSGSGG
jgi:putative ABC transport system ATP-binding protein